MRRRPTRSTVEVYVQFSFGVGKLDPIVQGSEESGSLCTLPTRVKNAREMGNVLAIVRGHVWMEPCPQTYCSVDHGHHSETCLYMARWRFRSARSLAGRENKLGLQANA
jgi:hypothetical protein